MIDKIKNLQGLTNDEKADKFPHWKVNEICCHAKKTKGVQNGYTIIKERNS